jgi:hypothetical protein
VLLAVVVTTWLDRMSTTSWDKTLWVGIFPINGDGSDVAAKYVSRLTVDEFTAIEDFFTEETSRYGVRVTRPVRIGLYPASEQKPPALAPGSNFLQTALWSLKMRWFARSAANVPGRAPSQIRIFVLYHDPAVNPSVPHSLGMQKGLVGVVHAFADKRMAGSNNIVIAHETLHTVGATDKYDLASGVPVFPAGYAEPDRSPRYPQRFAEIMAGQRSLSATEQEMPESLKDERVGSLTAMEIGWTRH